MQIACGNVDFILQLMSISTWGCSKFNFKSKNLPNQEVRQSTGMDCAYFTLKQVKNSTEGRSNGDQTIKIRLS